MLFEIGAIWPCPGGVLSDPPSKFAFWEMGPIGEEPSLTVWCRVIKNTPACAKYFCLYKASTSTYKYLYLGKLPLHLQSTSNFTKYLYSFINHFLINHLNKRVLLNTLEKLLNFFVPPFFYL